MHAKERVIGPHLAQTLRLEVVVTPGHNVHICGKFTSDAVRAGTSHHLDVVKRH